MATVGAIGAPLLRFVTPGDVRDLKNRLDPYVRALDAQTSSCASLPSATGAAWQSFSSEWRSYFDEDESWLHTAAEMDQGEAYETDIRNWQAVFAKSCTPTTPLPAATGTGADEWLPLVPWVAAAAIAVSVAYAAAPAIRAWAEGHARRRRAA